MKNALLLILLFCVANVFAQNVQQEINDQVWKPFIRTFNAYDTKGFMELHSRDLVRSSRDSKEVLNWEGYNKQTDQGNQRGKSSGSKRQIELRFTERIANTDQAIEVGIYKTTSIRSDGIARSFYGRFHVVLRKENGVWKILVDTDSSEGNSITEKNFLEAASLE
jgi:ketosteroid isomerase-like protein